MRSEERRQCVAGGERRRDAVERCARDAEGLLRDACAGRTRVSKEKKTTYSGGRTCRTTAPLLNFSEDRSVAPVCGFVTRACTFVNSMIDQQGLSA